MGVQQYYLDTIFRIQPCCKNTKITIGAENEEERHRISAVVGEGLKESGFFKFDIFKIPFYEIQAFNKRIMSKPSPEARTMCVST